MKTLIGSMLVVASGFVAHGQQPVPVTTNMDVNDLASATVTVRAVAGLPAFPRLPVMLEITVSNPTNRDLILPMPTLSDRENPWNTLDIVYSRGGLPEARVSHLVPVFGAWKEGLEPPFATLARFAPKSQWVTRVPLSYDWLSGSPAPIIEAGSIQIRASLCATVRDVKGNLKVDRSRSKDSQPLTISVAPAAGVDAAAVAELLKTTSPWAISAPESGDYLSISSHLEPFESFATRYASSPYGPYAKALLAHLHMSTRAPGSRLPSPDSVSRALTLLDEATASPHFVLARDAEQLRAKAQTMRVKQ